MDADAFWIAQEEAVQATLVDLADLGFTIQRKLFERKLSDDARCRVRPGVAEALVRAREQLPEGFAFQIWDGFRSWPEQELIAADVRRRLAIQYPDWDDARLDATQAVLSPPTRIIRRFDKHRYGGAIDLTLIDPAGAPYDMGGQGHAAPDPELSRLLHYELRQVEPHEEPPRDHRRVLIRAMESAGFEPYLAEWWHWGYSRDLSTA